MNSQGLSEAELLALSAPEQHMAAMAAQLQAPDQAPAPVAEGTGADGSGMKHDQVGCAAAKGCVGTVFTCGGVLCGALHLPEIAHGARATWHAALHLGRNAGTAASIVTGFRS